MTLWSNAATSSSLSKKPMTSRPEGARSRRNSVRTRSSSGGGRWMVEYHARMPAT